MEFAQMDLSAQRDGDVERSAAPQNSGTVSVEVVNGGGAKESFGAVRVDVVAHDGNGALDEKVAATEGSDRRAASDAGLDTNGAGDVKIVASDGSSANAEVGAAAGTDVIAAGEEVAAVEQIHGDTFYCHLCRQKRTGATPVCKSGYRKGNCLLKFCVRCIRNRYPKIAHEALNEEAWECPKCQNICTCSFCMRKKGKEPTGPMVRPGRKRKGSVDDTPANKKPRLEAENTDSLEDDIDLGSVHDTLANKKALLGAENSDALQDDIELPRGTPVTRIADIELQPEEVGASIQFLEFCRLFGKIFQIRKGQPEQIVKEITGHRQLRELPSVVAEIHIIMLSIIEKGKAKACEYSRHHEWIRKVGEYIADSALDAKDLTLDCLNQGVSGYNNLTPSCKLEVLNYLCDEALSTECEKEESVYREQIHAANKKILEVNKGQKDLNKPMEGGETTSNEEIENISSQLKKANEVKKAATNDLEELRRLLKATPVRVDRGVAYWKLTGYCNNNTNIMRQEFDDTVKNGDKWFMLTEDEQKVIEDNSTKR